MRRTSPRVHSKRRSRTAPHSHKKPSATRTATHRPRKGDTEAILKWLLVSYQKLDRSIRRMERRQKRAR